MRQERILAAARRWIGTPYRHQCSTRNAGADCLGLVRGVWREVLGREPAAVPNYTPDWSEPQREERLWRAADRYLMAKLLEDRGPADVLLFRMREDSVAKHLGIGSERNGVPTLIHAYTGHGVVETPLSEPWARRIVACFAFPDEVS